MSASSPAVPALRSELGFELARHAKLLHVLKGRLASRAPAGMDYAAVGLLVNLARCGPRRQGELAEVAVLDPSTTSRYVTQLVRAGLVERQADPDDGRAVQLMASTGGERLAADLTTYREELIRDLLDGWSEPDLTSLLTLIRRLNDRLDELRPSHQPATPPPDASDPSTEQEL